MSGFHLVLLLVVCACLAVSVRGQSDPTSACYAPSPSADGPALSDTGYWDLNGLQSYYSSDYLVLCAYRGYYLSGPAGTNALQYGPWHGNPNDTNCKGPTLSQFGSINERVRPGTTAVTVRTNSATGGKVVVSLRLNGTCDPTATICVGLCFGNPNYDTDLAALQADPTYEEYDETNTPTAPVSQPSANARTVQPNAVFAPPAAEPYVITTTNSTQYINGSVTWAGKTTFMSAITSVQSCYGQETLSC